MKITPKMDFVSGSFDTVNDKLVCVQSRKYGEVELCFKAGLNVTFAQIKLYSRNLAVDADAVFDDAVKLAEEICRRFNDFPKDLKK